MNQEEWRRLRELFEVVKGVPVQEQSAYLESNCDDARLKEEVQELIRAARADGRFLTAPVDTSWPEEATGPELVVGEVISGRYRLKQELGGGGFGRVFIAADEVLHEREVVLKFVLAGGMSPQEMRRRFDREIHALARIQHPGVVGVLDFGQLPEGMPFLVMNYVPGKTLEEEMNSGTLISMDRAIRLLQQTAAALGAAHDKGVLHRDLKPSNIILWQPEHGPEQAIIIDFGIATIRENAEECVPKTQVIGTPAYMAPEQWHGRATAQTDVWALALVAFELLTRHRLSPVSAGSSPENEAPRLLREMRPDLPHEAGGALARALAADEKQRYPGPEAFVTDLAALLAPPVRASSKPALRRQVVPWFAGSLITLALAGVYWRIAPGWDSKLGAPNPPRPVELRYWLLADKTAEGKPTGRPFLAGPSDVFDSATRLRIVFSANVEGFLYLMNQSGGSGKTSRLIFLYPGQPKGQSQPVGFNTELSIPSEPNWIVFDDEPGQEILWVLWSKNRLPYLDKVSSHASVSAGGEVTDVRQRDQLLSQLTAWQRTAQPGRVQTNNIVVVRGQSDLLCDRIELTHR